MILVTCVFLGAFSAPAAIVSRPYLPLSQSAVASSPTVALLPIVNEAGDKWKDLKEKEIRAGTEFLHKQFSDRGFSIKPDSVVAETLQAQKVDLSDVDQQGKETLYGVGQATGADYVEFAVITSTEGGRGGFPVHTDGTVRIQVWLLNVKARQDILSAQTFTGFHRGAGIGLLSENASSCQVKAVRDGLGKALKSFFDGFPVKKGSSGRVLP